LKALTETEVDNNRNNNNSRQKILSASPEESILSFYMYICDHSTSPIVGAVGGIGTGAVGG